MKVLHFNMYNTGGAAKAALRWHQSLLNQGVESKLIVLYKTDNTIDHVYDFREPLSFIDDKFFKMKNKLKRLQNRKRLSRFGPQTELISFPDSVWDLTSHPFFEEADIIHFHWVSGFLDWRSFFKKCNKPVFWSFQDHEPYTDGWHYDFGLDLKKLEKVLLRNRYIKLSGLGNTVLNVLAPSRFIIEHIKQTDKQQLLKNSIIDLLPNGLLKDEFEFIDKEKAREALGWAQEDKIVLFLSGRLDYARKGAKALLKAGKILHVNGIQLYLVGEQGKLELTSECGVNIIEPSDNQSQLNLFYAAADVFVTPTFADNLPNTVMEAQICGCPVVAFDTGGINEMAALTDHCKITKTKTPEDLALTIKQLLLEAYDRKKIRSQALKAFNIEEYTKQLISLYSEALKSH